MLLTKIYDLKKRLEFELEDVKIEEAKTTEKYSLGNNPYQWEYSRKIAYYEKVIPLVDEVIKETQHLQRQLKYFTKGDLK